MSATAKPSESLSTSFALALADREAEEVGILLGDEPDLAFGMPPLQRISDRAWALIVQHETGGRAYYEKVYKGAPVWPGGSSGVTIGFGYDLGYVKLDEFRSDWSVLAGDRLERLADVVGVRAGKDSSDLLKGLVQAVADIRIAWDDAEAVFRASSLPKFSGATSRALPNTVDLSGDSFGALVSLTFNRGASYGIAWDQTKDPIDRYREMRAIKEAVAGKRFGEVPGQIRAMKRVWRGKDIEVAMDRRREDEALLFEDGLGQSLS